MPFDGYPQPFLHRRNRHQVDIVHRGHTGEFTQRVTSRIGAGRYAVRGVVGDLVIVTGDAEFGCGAGIDCGEGLQVFFGYGIYRAGCPSQGPRRRRCRTASDRLSDSRS
jgi:hypothetical protein